MSLVLTSNLICLSANKVLDLGLNEIGVKNYTIFGFRD